MSVVVTGMIRSARIGSATEKSVLLKLGDCAADDGTRCYPSIARVAAETELDERTVRRSIKKLVESGHLTVLSVGHGSRASEYKINLSKLVKAENPYRAQSPASTTKMRGGTKPTLGTESDKRDGESGLKRAQSPDSMGTVPTSTIIEPSYNHYLTISENDQSRPEQLSGYQLSAANPQAAMDFECLYAIWPAKRKKPEARQAYFRAIKNGIKHEILLNGASRFNKKLEKEPPKNENFIQSLSDWLDSDGWTSTNGKPQNRKPMV